MTHPLPAGFSKIGPQILPPPPPPPASLRDSHNFHTPPGNTAVSKY